MNVLKITHTDTNQRTSAGIVEIRTYFAFINGRFVDKYVSQNEAPYVAINKFKKQLTSHGHKWDREA